MIKALGHLARDIKLSHSVFALPFALLAAFMARGGMLDLVTLGLILACMVLARTMAMAMNRWADRDLDRANPRTAGRAIPGGRVSSRFVLGAAMACGGLFVVACGGFYFVNDNVWPVLLSPAVLAWLAFYSFTKRFTWLCHLVLGAALAMSPPAAAVAVSPAFMRQPDAYLLAAMVLCWVAGFDVIYALQDVAVDRRMGLFSMPARLGVEPALWISRGLHLVSLASLITLLWVSTALSLGFAIGVAIVAGLLVLEHALVWGSKTHQINMAFFTVNGVISLLLGGLGIFDVLCNGR